MLLHGEVGRGKSMLLDLLADALPSRKKRRWHFNSFMLEIFRQLERLRVDRAQSSLDQEHSVLVLARDMIYSTPILFLDEFQLPDRAASKLLASFLTAFFHLGGVMVATSNRMPEELANAAGVEFYPEPKGVFGTFRGMLGMRKTAVQKAASSDFGTFLDVLKARCEVWEMEGEKDWRREDVEIHIDETVSAEISTEPSSSPIPFSSETIYEDQPNTASKATTPYYQTTSLSSLPPLPPDLPSSSTYQPLTLTIYSRPLSVPSQTPTGYTQWTFSQLCATNLGPADYITLASTYHTLILTNIPILTSTLKNEARRFITLLDALYESRCRLLILQAAAPISQLFFPVAPSSPPSPHTQPTASPLPSTPSDAITSESLSEIYQDRTSPFRPNISSYSPPSSSILASEDADFGPTYGRGRSAGASSGEPPQPQPGPDFTNPSLLTGQDELFAFRRAESRLWEMCGRRWWDGRPAGEVETWHRPVSPECRFWERTRMAEAKEGPRESQEGKREEGEGDEKRSLSPFRTLQEPPPRFGERHFWDLGLWGRRAGRWGKGVEGLGEEQGKGAKE
ncbi:MAG: hypothetical protein Q9160_001004 [Pyrenula sp. 1 TL-2023]